MNAGKINVLSVRTPEGIEFSLFLAGPVTRCLAWIVDFFCVSTVASALSAVTALVGLISADVAIAVGILLYFSISIGYGIFLEWFWRGQTVGKRMLKLRVMDAQGYRLEPSQIVIRNLLRFVDSLPLFYLIGGIACLLSRYGQRLGDFAANTIVVRHSQVAEIDINQLVAGKFNSFRHYAHLKARLRQRVTPHEAGLAVQGLLRRDELDPIARVELFGELAAVFRSKVDFPPEATDGLSDEQYVRNIVDVVFRDRKPALKQDPAGLPAEAR